MQVGQLIPVRTDPATQFTGALAQNAVATLNITRPPTTGMAAGYLDPGLGAGNTVRSILRSVLIASVENLAWEIWLWGKDTFNASTTNPAGEFPWGKKVFATGDAVRFAGAGLYYYYADGLYIPYQDLDQTGEIHLMLVNRSAASKSANANGAVLIQLNLEPCLGW